MQVDSRCRQKHQAREGQDHLGKLLKQNDVTGFLIRPGSHADAWEKRRGEE